LIELPDKAAAPKLRLFVAVTPPRAELEALARFVEPLHKRWADARWMEPDNQHITLKFLGSVEESRLGEVEAVVASAAANGRAGRASVRGMSAFPSPRRARVLWAGVHDPDGTIESLAHLLEDGFEALGFERESRPFTPHVTVARFKQPVWLETKELPDWQGPQEWPVERVDLYRSRLHPKGARYEILAGEYLQAR
jgi:RNA 2',3'-cyclic 3'-phosphodiesterase